MSSELTDLLTDLEAELKAALPDSWRVFNAESGPATNALAVQVTYELLDIHAEQDGQALPHGTVSADIGLVLAAPEKDPAKGTARVMAALPQLLSVLDQSDQIVWTDAVKGRDNAGTFYTLQITILATIPTE